MITMEEKKVVLIVEDDDVQANGIEHGLHHVLATEHDISVKTLRATDPTEATRQLDANDVALIVLDVNLANNTSGIDFAIELRKKYPYLPVIVLTQKSGDSFIEIRDSIANGASVSKKVAIFNSLFLCLSITLFTTLSSLNYSIFYQKIQKRAKI